jgi:hypothetical protein
MTISYSLILLFKRADPNYVYIASVLINLAKWRVLYRFNQSLWMLMIYYFPHSEVGDADYRQGETRLKDGELTIWGACLV